MALFSWLIAAISFTSILGQGCDHTICNPKMGDLIIGRQDDLKTTSTCGLNKPERYCVVNPIDRAYKDCNVCYSKQPYSALSPTNHDIKNVVSRVPQDDRRWWQSENGINNVTIQIDFETEFQFVYTTLRFKTYRPAAMYFERSFDFGENWHKYSFYSDNCEKDFPQVNRGKRAKLDQVTCVSQYSTLEPSENGLVTFIATPSELHLNKDFFSEEVQKLVKMTNLRAVFVRLNTLGDLTIGDHSNGNLNLKYYYSVYEWIIRGRCSCYGHASRCKPTRNQLETPNMVYGICECIHNTAGTNCQECEDFYLDQPWRPATQESSNECKKCECNDHASKCKFDIYVYILNNNKSGGVCIDCQHNTAGQNCEQCQPTYYRQPAMTLNNPDICRGCDCDIRGTVATSFVNGRPQCYQYTTATIIAGQCPCKTYAGGIRCDKCKAGYWNLTLTNSEGCQQCKCATLGTVGNSGCNQFTGACTCKRFVDGQNCDRCSAGYYNLSSAADGCSPCNCHPASSISNICNSRTGQCQCKEGFTGRACETILDTFYVPLKPHQIREKDKSAVLSMYPPDESGQYIIIINVTPNKFKERDLWQVKVENRPKDLGALCQGKQIDNIPINYTPEDSKVMIILPNVCLERGKKSEIIITPNVRKSVKDAFINIDSIRILPYNITSKTPDKKTIIGCESYRYRPENQIPEQCKEYLKKKSHVEIQPDSEAFKCQCNRTGSYSQICNKIEGQCTCRSGITGKNCDRCAELHYGFSSMGCKSCNCHGLGSLRPQCDVITGMCFCRENIEGQFCDKCRSGFYNFPDCQPCNCNNKAVTCDQKSGACTDCLDFTTGPRCERCLRNYYGDPSMNIPCKRCRCPGGGVSGQVVLDNAFNCNLNPATLKQVCDCKPGYRGEYCELCDKNHYGSAVTNEGCKPCICRGNIDRSVEGSCDPTTGECLKCIFHTTGTECERCLKGFYGFISRNGSQISDVCKPCECNNRGTKPDKLQDCDRINGVCDCQPNVIGKFCDRCQPNHFNFASGQGCEPCACDTSGTVGQSADCNELMGQCKCNSDRGGRRCDSCRDLYYGPSPNQCSPCNCNPEGSEYLQCHRRTGKCVCKAGVTGDKCDRCDSGTSGSLPKCVPCGDCWKYWSNKSIKLYNISGALYAEAQKQVERRFSPENKRLYDDALNRLKSLQDLAKNLTTGSVRNLQEELDSLEQNMLTMRQKMDQTKSIVDSREVSHQQLVAAVEELRRNLERFKNTESTFLAALAKIKQGSIVGAFELIQEAGREGDKYEESMNQMSTRFIKLSGDVDSQERKIDQILKSSSGPVQDLTLAQQKLKLLDNKMCGSEDPTNTNNLFCSSECGGGGCKFCAKSRGVCSSSSYGKYLQNVELIRNTTNDLNRFSNDLIPDMQRKIDEAMNIANGTYVTASDVLEYAKNLSISGINFTSSTKQLLIDVKQFLWDNSNVTRKSYDDLQNRLLNYEFKIDNVEFNEVISGIKQRLGELTQVDTILTEANANITTAQKLKDRAKKANDEAKQLLTDINSIEGALQNAKLNQSKAESYLNKAQSLKAEIERLLEEFDNKERLTKTQQNRNAGLIAGLRDGMETFQRNIVEAEDNLKKIQSATQNAFNDIEFIKIAMIPRINDQYLEAKKKQDIIVNQNKRRKEKLLLRATNLMNTMLKKLKSLEDAEVKTSQMNQELEILYEKTTEMMVEMDSLRKSIERKSWHSQTCKA